MLCGKQGHLHAMNQPWGSREHLHSMHGADVSQQQGLTCHLWWPDLWVAWSKNMAVSSHVLACSQGGDMVQGHCNDMVHDPGGGLAHDHDGGS